MPRLFIHVQCMMTEDYQVWHREQCKEVPAYDRYWKLMTVGLPMTCKGCSAEFCISPKSVGFGAGAWELNCNVCSATSHEKVFQEPMLNQLAALREEFCIAATESESFLVLEMVEELEKNLEPILCTCGGSFTLVAYPRCPFCSEVAITSCFHSSFATETEMS